MKALIDTNVILDVWLERQPFFNTSSSILTHAERRSFDGLVCATSVTTLYFLAGRLITKTKARTMISILLGFCDVSPVSKHVLQTATTSKIADYEDAVIAESGRAANVDCIITRDRKGFRKDSIRVYSPTEYLAELELTDTNGNGA